MKYLSALLLSVLFFSSCSSDKKTEVNENDSTSVKKEDAVIYNYSSQLFRVDPLEFKLNKDDLPFLFDNNYLRGKKIKSIRMEVKINEGKKEINEHYNWLVNEHGQIVAEEKSVSGKIANSIRRKYTNDLLTSVEIANPGSRFETAIKKVDYVYSNGKLITVYDVMENNDTIITQYNYNDRQLITKSATLNGKFVQGSSITYLNGNPIKIELYKAQDGAPEAKAAIYTYTYTKDGKLLYGDHWYPGISNDTYTFEFDSEGRVKEITYNIYLMKEGKKIPGKTKSYRYEYENDLLKRINYFQQAPTFSQNGKFDFTYEYY
jgi:hypothetical protein